MSDVRLAACRKCMKLTNAKNAYYCPSCGEYLCETCAKQNNGVCRRCFSPLDLFS